MIVSKLTSKAQTTIPQPVRAALHLQPGDEIVYEIVDDRVILTRARSRDRADDPFRAFAEWSSEAADAVRLGRLAASPLRRAIERIVSELSGAGECPGRAGASPNQDPIPRLSSPARPGRFASTVAG